MRNKGGARLAQRTRNEMRGDGRKKDRKGGEEGISRKGKGQTEGEKKLTNLLNTLTSKVNNDFLNIIFLEIVFGLSVYIHK